MKGRVASRSLGLFMVVVIVATACSDPGSSANPEVVDVAATREASGGQPTPTPVEQMVPMSPEDIEAAVAPVAVAANPRIGRALDVVDTPRVPGEVIRVGGLVSEADVDGEPALNGWCAGARARFEQANASGTLSRPIELTTCLSDFEVPTAATSAVDELIADDVFAVVPMGSTALFDGTALREARIPYVGLGRSPIFCGVDTNYGFAATGAQACPVLGFAGFTVVSPGVLRPWAASANLDAPQVLLVVDDSADGAVRADAHRYEAAIAGFEVVDTVTIAVQTEPEELEGALAPGLADGPDVVVIDARRPQRVADAMAALGSEAEIITTAETIDGASRLWVGRSPLGSGAEWAAIVGAAEAAGLTADEIATEAHFVDGFIVADFFVRAVADVEASGVELSAEAVHDLINSGWVWPGIEGVACGSSWPTAHLVPTPCAAVSAEGAPGRLDRYEILVEPVG